MEEYIKKSCEALKSNKISGVCEMIQDYSKKNAEQMLLNAGYFDPKVVEQMEKSKEFININGEKQISDSEKEKILLEYKKDILIGGYTKNKNVIYILGLPGAGKSTIANEIEKDFKDSKFLHIDADNFKFGINQSKEQIVAPLANSKLKGIDINSIHELSSELALLALEAFSESSYDLLLPKVGGNLKTISNSIKNIRDKGYKIYIHFVFTTVETSLKRNLQRFNDSLKTNKHVRLVDPTYIINLGYKPLYNFFQLVKDSACNGFTFWNGEEKPPKKYLLK